MELNKDSLPALAIAALLGTSGGSSLSTYLQSSHLHPEIIREIREVEYEMEIERTNLKLADMEDRLVPRDSAEYIATTSKLTHFNQLLQDLKK